MKKEKEINISSMLHLSEYKISFSNNLNYLNIMSAFMRTVDTYTCSV